MPVISNRAALVVSVALCAFSSAVRPLVHAATFVVDPRGTDTNAGTLAEPFATLRRAQQAARQIAGRESVTVVLRAGTYYLPDPLAFSAEDSGTRAAPVVYESYLHEEAVISGGMRLPPLSWAPWRDGIMQATVPDGLTGDQLFVNGRRQPMARYPNYDSRQRIFNGYAADVLDPQRIGTWADPRGGFLHAMHRHMWGDYHYRITGKDAGGALQYEGGWQNNRQMGMHDEYRFVENVLEELDAPGEWFLDGSRHVLYFYPPADLELGTAGLELVRLRHLVELRGNQQQPVKFITIKGLVFRHASRTFMDNREPMVRSDWTTYRGGAAFLEGTEDCALEDCFFDQVGGNAIFVNNYNRRVTIRGCHIAEAGASGVALVGDPQAARNPLFEYGQRQRYADIDKTPGPRSDNYPADCLVDDCLIYRTGRDEKQTAGVQIELAQGITVRHCSIYDVPRAGINIGDGCWGGHTIELCDVFDTVLETGDHGSFNSWGRDRFWGLTDLDLNDDAVWQDHQETPRLDVVKPIVLRNNRWRCDHGWDIDLDDGSSNYIVTNNLCLNGGIKNREGFYRVVENNIIVNNGFHPHVWYKHSQDVVRRNIMWSDHYHPAGGMPDTPWGREMDQNLVHRPGVTVPQPAALLVQQSQRDAHSIVADALFVDARAGDFRVLDNSPAISLGFVNFPMDRFGVQKLELKALARTPQLPAVTNAVDPDHLTQVVQRSRYLWQARVRDVSGLGDRSAYGLPGEQGVLALDVPETSDAARVGLQRDDVILNCNGRPVRNIAELLAMQDQAAGKSLSISLQRKQETVSLDVTDYAFVQAEFQDGVDFQSIPLAATSAVPSATLHASAPGTVNEPLSTLTDGRLAPNYGPVFGNGVTGGAYKMDLGEVRDILQVNTFSFNQNDNRGRQRFVLYGSRSSHDPGWQVENAQVFTAIVEVDTQSAAPSSYLATSVRRGTAAPVGAYRWLVWAILPVTTTAGGENTAFQEFQVILAP